MRSVRVVAGAIVVLLTAVLHAQLVVSPGNDQGWSFNTTDSNPLTPPPPRALLAEGFETPPLGVGSVRLAIGPEGGDNAEVRQPGYEGTPLSNITALSYSTFVEVDGSGGQAPYLLLQVDTDGDPGIEDLFFFEPLYQGAAFFPSNPQGPLVTDTWQTWDALAGGWYALSGLAGSGPGANVKSWGTMLAALPPGASLLNSISGAGGVRIVTGFGAGAWDNFLGAADNFTIGVSGVDTTYDFEAAPPTKITVTIPSPDDWTFQVVDDDGDTFTTGTFDIVPGPATPPLGDGSLEFTLGTEGEDGVQARNDLYDGEFLRDLGTLRYSTYVQNFGSGGQAPYITLDVDLTNDGIRDDLWFFEPVYQDGTFCPSSPQATVALNTWQTWDAAGGCWYSLFGLAGSGPGANVVPLATLLEAEPDASVSSNIAGGSFRVVTGFGDIAWDNFVGNADAVTVNFVFLSTINYDFEPVPTIIINDVSLNEGTGGTTNFTFTLTLSEAVSQTVTVNYTVNDDTATAADGDYAPLSGTATFAPTVNPTSATVTVVVTADNKFEPNETFFVDLSNPQFATIADPQGIGTILNDDVQPQILISDVAQNEGNAATTPFNFNVTLSNPSFQTITVNFTTNPDTATEGVDYADATGTVTFVPDDVAETIPVQVTGETAFEPSETFFVDLSGASNATLGDIQGLGTIQNDDGPVADLSITKSVVRTGEFLITVTNAGPQTASNVVVTDPIQPPATLLGANPSQGSCSGTTTVVCTLGAIASGGTATIQLLVTSSSSIDNTATVTNTPEIDPTPGNNTATASMTINVDAPTLSEWALIALAAMLAAVALRRIV